MTMPNHYNEYAIGIDIGGTKTLLALVRQDGTIIRQLQFESLPEQGAERIIARIEESVVSLIASMPEAGKLKGIGICSAGVIDPVELSIVYAANLNWHNVKVGAILQERFQVPVLLGNDANLAAVAEYVWGTKKQDKHLIYVTVSTGIGSGIIANGQLLQGITASAGEFGHISVDLKGERCGCGNYGCLENYSSGTALARLANERLEQLETPWTSKLLLEQASAGHAGAIELVQEAAFYLGNSIVTMIHLFNPTQVIFGGGVMSSDNLLYQLMTQVIDERTLPEMRKHVVLRRTELGKEIAVLGAAGMFFMNE